MGNKELNYSCAECDSIQLVDAYGTQCYCSLLQQAIDPVANCCHHFSSESLGIKESEE